MRKFKSVGTLLLAMIIVLVGFSQTRSQSGDHTIYLPLVSSPNSDPVPVPTDDGTCPENMSLFHESGFSGIVEPDTFDPEVDGWDEYFCLPNESAAQLTCSDHGSAQVISGVATCSCDEGYVGEECEQPAPTVAEPEARIVGLTESLTQGELVELTASSIDSSQNSATNGRWSIEASDGCLLSSRDSKVCLTEFAGNSVFFQAPADNQAMKMAAIKFAPSDGSAPLLDTVLVQPPGSIPVSGYGRPQLEPVLAALEQFMKDHCVGAGLLGISHFGNPVGVWGLGKIHGRASSTIFNPECPDDEIDPHYPQAPNVSHTSPFKIGSVTKTVTYAIGRWAIKNRLQELDTDVDIVAPAQDRLVSAIRTAEGTLRLDSWEVNSSGVEQHLGHTEAGLARDFSIISLNSERIVVGVRTLNNNLKIIVWQLNADGSFERLHDDEAGTVKNVSVVAVSESRLAAAVQIGNDEMKIIIWDVAPDGQLTRRGDIDAGRVRDIQVAALSNGNTHRLVTAVSTNEHRLKFIAWDIDSAGELTRGDDLDISSDVYEVDLVALGSSRLAVAARTDTDGLKVFLINLSRTGILSESAQENVGSIKTLSISPTGPSGFAVVVSRPSGAFRLLHWTIDSSGTLNRRDDGSAGTSGGSANANIIYANGDTFNSILFTAVRTAESTLKIIPWNVTGVTPQRLANDSTGEVIADYPWSDDDVEALGLFGYDIPEGLLPEQLDRLFGGKDPLPALDPPIGGVTVGTSSCEPLAGFADPQWKSVQLKHIFAHRTGLPRSAISHNNVVRNYIDEWRGLDTQNDYVAQENLLRSLWGDENVENARVALGWNASLAASRIVEGVLVPPATLDETLMTVAARCLPLELGQYRYSNTDPSILRRIAEHIMDAPYAADAADPSMPNYLDQHEGSILQQFFQSELGISTTASDGIFASHFGLNSASDNSEPGPTARDWQDNEVGTKKIYPEYWDRKRPHCIMAGDGTCSFSSWANPDETNADPARSGRINWYWEKEKVPLRFDGGSNAATGSLRVEARLFLKFMANYWVGSYDENPGIGEPRHNTWSPSQTHNGSLAGGYAYAFQFGGSSNCRAAQGVDVIVAVNQNSDKTGERYRALRRVIRQAVCSVDWDEVEPYPTLVIADP